MSGIAKHWIVPSAGSHTCPICLESINEGEAVVTCNCQSGTHGFHKHCLAQWLPRARNCPHCQAQVGIYQGTQPKNGYMAIETKGFKLAGFDCATLVITYNIEDGIQEEEHPEPGEYYEGTYRRAFLPFNSEGLETLRLLKLAFDNRNIFRVGQSLTTGQNNVTCWSTIPHKTVANADINNYIEFGFPDANYFDRVKYQCNNLGIY